MKLHAVLLEHVCAHHHHQSCHITTTLRDAHEDAGVWRGKWGLTDHPDAGAAPPVEEDPFPSSPCPARAPARRGESPDHQIEPSHWNLGGVKTLSREGGAILFFSQGLVPCAFAGTNARDDGKLPTILGADFSPFRLQLFCKGLSLAGSYLVFQIRCMAESRTSNENIPAAARSMGYIHMCVQV